MQNQKIIIGIGGNINSEDGDHPIRVAIKAVNYLKDYSRDDVIDIFSMCKKIIQGHNKNEILLVPKKRENKGFFEKFFNFFS